MVLSSRPGDAMSDERPEHDDPFDGIVFDEDFVKGARKREPSAEDRVGRAAALRSSIDADARNERAARRPDRRLRRWAARVGSRRRWLMIVIVLALIAALIWWEMNHRDPVAWQGGDPMAQLVEQL